jgi:ElaB/YqjD/DUF883 family membrane-anchored ribosome-binding protein
MITHADTEKDAAAARHDLQRAIDALSHAADAIRSSGNEMTSAAGGYIKANPLTAVGAAAAAGLLVGLLLARR